MDQKIINLLEILEEQGYQAYLVGGYVRDFLMGKHSDDIDLATDATPEELKSLFKDYHLTGEERFGNVNIDGIQCTTFRKESYVPGNRYPQVSYTDQLSEDVLRRDFTMNAIYMSKDGQLIDLVQGMDDIQNRVICTIKDPNQSFQEDPLRMVRALRFAKMLDFQLDQNVLAAIQQHASLLKTISNVRLKKEIEKGKDFGFTEEDLKKLLIK